MTERDAFEARFGAAVRGYVGSVSSELDPAGLAHRIAEEEPRHHGFAAVLGWRGVAIPRVAWVLLLLAGLLAALVGGTLLVGSQLQQKLPAVVPNLGPVATCPPGSTPDEPGPIDQARPLEVSALAFDRRAGRLVALAGAETWTFDVCTNTWTQMHPDRVPSSLEWPQLVYDVDSKTTIFASYGSVWAYDLQTDTWTEKGVAPTDAYWIVYDPVSGLVVAGNWDPTALWEYDVETDTWTPIRPANGPEMYGPFAYDASVDRMVMAGGPSGSVTWLLDMRTGRWSAAGAETPDVIEVFATAPAIVYDEAAERTVLIGDVPRLAAYDATADRWEILAEADPDRAVGFQLHAVYDPVNGRLIGWPRDQDELVAFDLVTREWTVLLAASERQPRPYPGATPRP